MSEADMRLTLPEPLRTLVVDKFTQAKASKSLVFSDTYLVTLRNKAGIPFQLRYCPALSKKPVDNKQVQASSDPPKKKFDPFEDPSPDLLIARIPNPTSHTHNLVLNKYPVIPNHFILSTRENKPQTHLLEEDDLYLTHACVQAWQDQAPGKKHQLYAFFNTGEHSGASQPHRHLQFLPAEDMSAQRQSQPQPQTQAQCHDTEWSVLCDSMTTRLHPTLDLGLYHNPALPIIHLATPITASITPAQLHAKYHHLLRATSLLLSNPHSPPASILTPSALTPTLPPSPAPIPIPFSHNLALTPHTLAILPRRAEAAELPLSNANSNPGTSQSSVSINGTILAGTLMVRTEAEFEAVIARPELVDGMLAQIGFGWGSGWDGGRL